MENSYFSHKNIKSIPRECKSHLACSKYAISYQFRDKGGIADTAEIFITSPPAPPTPPTKFNVGLAKF